MISVERKKALWTAMQKLEAYRLIQNEMGRTVAAFNFRQVDKVLSHFALDQKDVSVEYCDEGVFRGPDPVRNIIREIVGAPARPGEMIDLQLTTPVIEIAEDMQTAKCLWWMPGAGAVLQKNGDPRAVWIWGELSVDFMNQEGTWKIWHLHYFRFIKCDYKKGWVEDTSMINRLNVPLHPEAEVSTYHNPYSPLSIRDGIPCAPRPYKTWDQADLNWELDRNKNWQGGTI